ncbi:MAG: hypothetical protein RR665_00115 [Malacoplasma sp.]
MLSSEKNEIFNITSLTINFKTKIDVNQILREIEKKYSLNEITKFSMVAYYKNRNNVVLITLSNEKIFIWSNKYLPINDVYNYSELINILPSKNFFKKGYVISFDNGSEFNLKGLLNNDVIEFNRHFSIIKNNLNNLYLKDINVLDINRETKLENSIEEVAKNRDETTLFKKRVVNDLIINNSTSLSSFYIYELLTKKEKILPNGENTLFGEIIDRINGLEKRNVFNFDFDSIPLKFSSDTKLNTVPIVAEFSSLVDSTQHENRFLFARNWIEYTRHNVKNKLLGVDENGNGAYLELSTHTSNKKIVIYKAREYKVNDELRYGLRSGQTISFFEKNQKIGIDSLYFNVENNNKLNLTNYDGLIFIGTKYYFNTLNEFSKLQKKYCRIFHQERKNNGDLLKSYEIIFEDDLISYKVFNERGILMDDLFPNSYVNDLKWLTFFID